MSCSSTRSLTSDPRDSSTSLSGAPGFETGTCDASHDSSTSTCDARDGLGVHATSSDDCERHGRETWSCCDVSHGSGFVAGLCSCFDDGHGFDCGMTSGETHPGLLISTCVAVLDFRRDVDARRRNLCCRAFVSSLLPPLSAFFGPQPPCLSPPWPSSSPPRLCRWRHGVWRIPCAACRAGGRRFVVERRRRSEKLRKFRRLPWLSAERCTRL